MIEVREFKEPLWGFEKRDPFFLVDYGDYKRSVEVDPFPAYPHDVDLVSKWATYVSTHFPIPQYVLIAVLGREPRERTNGWTSINQLYRKEEEDSNPFSATICLAAKRIPPHPAMTRYLVAHEYGHVVAETLRRKFSTYGPCADPSCKDEKCKRVDNLYGDYATMRGFKTAAHYGGGTWHASVEELFANDFRILVTHTEIEFWPHPGFARPEEVPAIVDFWKREAEENKCSK